MAGLVWDKDAEKALKKVPFFVRSLVRRKVEERVQKRNGNGGAYGGKRLFARL